MFEKFPYTNFHELNLDWIIEKIKKLGERVDKFESGEQRDDYAKNWLYGKKIVVYGDSTAAIPNSYWRVLAEKYPWLDITNRAIGGTQMTYSGDGKSAVELLAKASDLHTFDLLFLCYGTNDWATSKYPYGLANTTFNGALLSALKSAYNAKKTIDICAILPFYSTMENDIPQKNRPGYTLAEYTTICNSIYASYGIKCINFSPICSENAFNYESLTDAEVTVTHVHENRFFAERLAEYVLNANFTQTQEFYYHGNNAFTSLLFPTNIASIDDLKATPLNYVGTNSFKFTAGSHISNHTFTANPEQNINFYGYASAPFTIKLHNSENNKEILSQDFRVGHFNTTFNIDVNFYKIEIITTTTLILAGVHYEISNLVNDNFIGSFGFPANIRNAANCTKLTNGRLPRIAIHENVASILYGGFTATEDIAAYTVFANLPISITETVVIPASINLSRVVLIFIYQGGGIVCNEQINNGSSIYLLPCMFELL